ncbi:penicillin acylase family protein [Bacillus marinisedimentorum]|uniref:penicillin acylase family protein n=1 Tax=Bacillus marinisedimentorum TaxID=1821260 RepID=UPI0007DEC049|nr:penicillin acylase family protein [Bacillus marinisedimentorum]
MKKGLVTIVSTALFMTSLITGPLYDAAAAKTPASHSVTVESTKLLKHQGHEVKIARDSYGVPHVYGDDESSLFFGTGFAMAEDRLWQAELSRIVASGRMTEFFGGTDQNIAQDMVIRRDGYTDEEIMNQFLSLPEYVQNGMHAYIEGINHYIETVPFSALPLEFQGKKPAKWTIIDSLKVQQLMVRRFGESGGGELNTVNLLNGLVEKLGPEEGLKAFETVYWKNDPEAPVSLTEESNQSTKHSPKKDFKSQKFPEAEKVARQLEKEQQMKLDIEKAYGFPHKGGSNAWIIGPSRSESGGTLLLGGPQMGYSVPQIAHEIGLHGAGYNTVGMAFAGAAGIPLIGRGNDYSWTTTTGGGDQIDTFVLKINPTNSEQYLYNGKWVDFEVRNETIKAVGKEPLNYKVYRSVYGPVIYKDNQVAYTQKRAHWEQELNAMTGFWTFNRAHNIKQFEEGVHQIPTSHNFLYNDKQGNIGYWMAGRKATRAEGKDGRLPMNGDGSEEWQGIESPDTLPHAVNPKQGVVANWNNKPSPDWDNTEWIFGKTHRAQFILDQLAVDHSISFADMKEINKKAGTVDLEAYFFKGVLLEKVNRDSLSEEAQEAVSLVGEWDGYFTDQDKNDFYDAQGTAIFDKWFEEVKGTVLSGLKGTGVDTNDLLYNILLADQETLQANYSFLGPIDLNQIVTSSLEEVADLNGDYFAPIRKINFSKLGAGGVEPIPYMNRGTYNQIIEFTRKDAKSVNILPPGQSGDRRSPHFDDQREMYADWEYKPMNLDILKPNKR